MEPDRLFRGRRDRLVEDRIQQRPDEEGVTAGRLVERDAERLVGLQAEELGREGQGRRMAECRGAEHVRLRVGDQLGERWRLSRCAFGAGRRDDHERQAVDPAGEVCEPPKRWSVEPVDVVQPEDGRPFEREVCRQPVEPVEDDEGRIRQAFRSLAELRCDEDRLRESGGSGEQLLAGDG